MPIPALFRQGIPEMKEEKILKEGKKDFVKTKSFIKEILTNQHFSNVKNLTIFNLLINVTKSKIM